MCQFPCVPAEQWRPTAASKPYVEQGGRGLKGVGSNEGRMGRRCMEGGQINPRRGAGLVLAEPNPNPLLRPHLPVQIDLDLCHDIAIVLVGFTIWQGDKCPLTPRRPLAA